MAVAAAACARDVFSQSIVSIVFFSSSFSLETKFDARPKKWVVCSRDCQRRSVSVRREENWRWTIDYAQFNRPSKVFGVALSIHATRDKRSSLRWIGSILTPLNRYKKYENRFFLDAWLLFVFTSLAIFFLLSSLNGHFHVRIFLN